MKSNTPDTKSGPVLTVENLSVEFRSGAQRHKAVSGISFALQRGTTLGIVGESGSGKSVTSLAVMRLLPQNSGTISSGSIVFHPAGGQPADLTLLGDREMRTLRGKRIAMIFQEPMTSLNPLQRCGRQVMESMLLHENISRSEARKRTLALFGEVMLPDPEIIFRAYPHQVSGGQKQRVMIAMALSCKPDILIADEPTTALDVTVQKNILALLRQLQQKYSLSLIFISHNLDVVAEIAQYVLVMHKGQVVENGSIADIFKNPQHPYTQGLLACRPPAAERPLRLKVIADFTENAPAAPEVLITHSERAAHHKKLYSGSPVLEVVNLHTSFTQKKNLLGRPVSVYKAVDGVSFSIYPGETLGLVGESGCGKTTLGRTLLRLVEPDSGEAVFRGTGLMQLKPDAMRRFRKKMQIVFQDPYSSLNPRFTAGQAITEPMKVHGLHGSEAARKDRMLQLLKQVGLDRSHAGRYPHEFSGGQRQRICIARALAVDPEFIICDESVSALDVSVQAQVLNLLSDLKKDFGLTYLFISHDLSVVRYMSDRIMVMHNGRIIETGEADALYSNPVTAYTRKLLEAVPEGIH